MVSKTLFCTASMCAILSCSGDHGPAGEVTLPRRQCPGGHRGPPFSRPRARVRLAELERRRAGQIGEDPGRVGAGHHGDGRIDGACRRPATIPTEMKTRGYITLIRRNWHLLPYDQLLELVEMTPEQLDFRLARGRFLVEQTGSVEAQVRAVALPSAGRGGPAPRGRDQAGGRGGVRRGDPPSGRAAFRFRAAVQQQLPSSARGRGAGGKGGLRRRTSSTMNSFASSIPILRSTATRC